MSAVSGEDMQDRTDRAILTPWLKFLWESYRQCLDLLRNNVTVEKLYHEVAQNGNDHQYHSSGHRHTSTIIVITLFCSFPHEFYAVSNELNA